MVENHTTLLRLPFNAANKLCCIVNRASAARAISELIWALNNSLYYIDTDEIPGFLLLLKNHIFTARSEDTIFIFHV